MQFKEFSLLSPVIEAPEVFKAIETVISPDVIAQSLGNTNSVEERVSQTAFKFGGLFSDCHEPVVIRFNGHCTQESSQWFE